MSIRTKLTTIPEELEINRTTSREDSTTSQPLSRMNVETTTTRCTTSTTLSMVFVVKSRMDRLWASILLSSELSVRRDPSLLFVSRALEAESSLRLFFAFVQLLKSAAKLSPETSLPPTTSSESWKLTHMDLAVPTPLLPSTSPSLHLRRASQPKATPNQTFSRLKPLLLSSS